MVGLKGFSHFYYPGVVQSIERAVWDREARGFEPHHSDHLRMSYNG